MSKKVKKYPPELFDAIRDFIGLSPALEDDLYRISFKNKFIKTISKEKIDIA